MEVNTKMCLRLNQLTGCKMIKSILGFPKGRSSVVILYRNFGKKIISKLGGMC
jgi:hypothetical protein